MVYIQRQLRSHARYDISGGDETISREYDIKIVVTFIMLSGLVLGQVCGGPGFLPAGGMSEREVRKRYEADVELVYQEHGRRPSGDPYNEITWTTYYCTFTSVVVSVNSGWPFTFSYRRYPATTWLFDGAEFQEFRLISLVLNVLVSTVFAIASIAYIWNRNFRVLEFGKSGFALMASIAIVFTVYLLRWGTKTYFLPGFPVAGEHFVTTMICRLPILVGLYCFIAILSRLVQPVVSKLPSRRSSSA